jgi:folylpolyglutamate synthase/dihydropteroate synthase
VELADIVASVGGGAEVSVNVAKSLQRALAVMDPGDALLATGSIFLVAEVREEWARYTGVPVPDNDHQ